MREFTCATGRIDELCHHAPRRYTGTKTDPDRRKLISVFWVPWFLAPLFPSTPCSLVPCFYRSPTTPISNRVPLVNSISLRSPSISNPDDELLPASITPGIPVGCGTERCAAAA